MLPFTKEDLFILEKRRNWLLVISVADSRFIIPQWNSKLRWMFDSLFLCWFEKTRDYRFDFADLDKLTIFSDNVIPAVLRKLNILDLIDKDLERAISSCQSLPAGSEQEIELRLCAIHACSLIVQNARRQGLDLKEMDLDYYLWLKGKDRGFREFERHYTKDTYFYWICKWNCKKKDKK